MTGYHRYKKQHWDDDDKLVETERAQQIEQPITGSIYTVPDKFWGFQALGREHHPGICVWFDDVMMKAMLLKGSDPQSCRFGRTYYINPTPENGLSKRTGFEIKPRVFSLRHILLWHESRRIGTVTSNDLEDIRKELGSLFAIDTFGGEK